MRNIDTRITIVRLVTTVLFLLAFAPAMIGQTPTPSTEATRAQALLSEGQKLLEANTSESASASLEKFAEASRLFKHLDNKQFESYCLAFLGNANLLLGANQKALEYYKQALPLIRFVGDKYGEAVLNNLIGMTHAKLFEYSIALEYFNQAVEINRVIKNRSGEIQALSNTAYCQRQLYEFANAIAIYTKVLILQKEIGDQNGEGRTLNEIGLIYLTLGNKEKALMYFNQSLPLLRIAGDKSGEANVLISLGGLHSELSSDSQKAIDYYIQATTIVKAIGDKSFEAIILNNIGYALSKIGHKTKALEYYNNALQLNRLVGNRPAEARVLDNIGKIHYELNEYSKALSYYNQALQIARETGFREGEVWTLNNLMLVWNSLNRRSLSIFYGKQSVDLYQQARSRIRSLDIQTQKEFVKYVEETYRYLAGILISEGRFPEAQHILGLLKNEEYDQLNKRGDAPDTVPYSKVEADVIAKIEKLVALERERTELQKLKTLTTEQEAKLEQLRLDIAAANKAFDTALDALGKAEASAATRVDEIKGGQEIQSALQSLGKETKSGVVALYTVIGTDEPERKHPAGSTSRQDAGVPFKSKFGWVIMVTEKGYKAYPIDVTNLEETVFQFRTALSSTTYNPQPLAEKIYKAIFRQTSAIQKRTLEADLHDYLKSHKDKTLMWSLDGVLRYIPMAALHDGQQYLVQNYRNVVFTRQSFLWLTKENQADWKALGLGVSESRPNESFSALPGVKTELETIVREPNSKTGILNGSIKLNDNFKKQMFFNTVGGGLFPVVHIASHYSFNPMQQDASFLLIGDGRLSFMELKVNKNLFGTVDLLTLSACDTGVSGNGKEAEGFAYLAQSLGAKSVIASLWKVSDAGTPELMIRFYKLRAENPQMSKGEAFRRAQLSLLGIRGTNTGQVNSASKVDPSRTDKFVEAGNDLKLPLFVRDPSMPYAHPHYWSSFVLIGNWR